jgi:hypothetical protein
MLPRRVLLGLGALWAALVVPGVSLWGHECHGVVGFFAHTPLYAFQGLSGLFVALGVLWAVRRAAGAR